MVFVTCMCQLLYFCCLYTTHSPPSTLDVWHICLPPYLFAFLWLPVHQKGYCWCRCTDTFLRSLIRYKTGWKLCTHQKNSQDPQCTGPGKQEADGLAGLTGKQGPSSGTGCCFWWAMHIRNQNIWSDHVAYPFVQGPLKQALTLSRTHAFHCQLHSRKSNEWCMFFAVGRWEARWDEVGRGRCGRPTSQTAPSLSHHPFLWLWLKIIQLFPKQLMNMQQGNKPWLKATDLSIVCISSRLSNTSRVL